MKQIFFGLFILSIFSSCGDSASDIAPKAKLKTMYIYSSSAAAEPYSFTTYTYDKNWNLTKELISDYPKPPTSSCTYYYDSKDRLSNKKYNGKTGLNHSNQTEAVFSVIREYKYQYIDDLQIETIYRDDELNDSVVYKLYDDLILEEHHYSKTLSKWSIINEYDVDGNLVKKTELPGNLAIEFEYVNSKLIKSTSYNEQGDKVTEVEYVYSKVGNKLIRECGMEKATYINGNIIEYIRYHPTFPGSEWWCHRYEYF